MKTYLLLFISSLLLLFTLPESGSQMGSLQGMEQSVVKKACASKRLVKRTCHKGCLKHQTHSEQQQSANTVTDCSQQIFAVVPPLQQHSFLAFAASFSLNKLTARKHLPPSLEAEPDPPQCS